MAIYDERLSRSNGAIEHNIYATIAIDTTFARKKNTPIDTKGVASSIVSSGADTTSNLFRKFKDTTASAIDKTKSKTDQVSDSATHQAQAAWQDTKGATKEAATKTKQKANQAMKNAQQSANFLGKNNTTQLGLKP